MNQMKIGIIGGTFNPIHYGHLTIASKALKQYSLDQVVFIPTGNSYHKDQLDILPAEIRYDMVSLAINEMQSFEISDIDMKRRGNTYTIDTLNSLSKTMPNSTFYLIMGEDSFLSVEKWKYPDKIFKKCILLVALRDVSLNTDFNHYKSYIIHKYQAKIKIINSPFIDVSSSDIRERIQNGETYFDLVPKNVCNYIEMNKLYKK